MNSLKSLLSVCLLFLASSAFSNVYYVDHQGNSGIAGDPWNNVYTSVDAVLSIATAGDIIHVSQGSYPASSASYAIPNGVRMYGGYPSNGTVYYLFRNYLRNADNYPTILTGDDVIEVAAGLSNQTYLDGFQLQGVDRGMLIDNSSGSSHVVEPIFANCTFSGGIAGVQISHGGTIRPQFNNCRFINSNEGLVIRGEVAAQVIAPKFSQCEITNNQKGINFTAITGNMIPEFDRCRVFDNAGYAIVNGNGPGSGSGVGYAYLNFCPSPNLFSYHPRFTNTLFYGNGGILNSAVAIGCPTKDDLSVYFDHCTMYDNAPASGTPAFNLKADNINFLNTNARFVFKMENCISWNNMLNGVLMRLETAQRCRIQNSLIEPTNCFSSGNNANAAYILVNPHQWVTQVINDGGNIYNQNPLFVNPTATIPQLHLLAASPARNAGNNALIGLGVDIDFRNYLRVIEGNTDMGAYEYCPKFYNCSPTATPAIGFKSLEAPETTMDFEAYPNPFENVVYVDKNGTNFTKIEVLDLSGKVLLERRFDAERIELSTQNLVSGVYLIRASANEEYTIKKLIKK